MNLRIGDLVEVRVEIHGVPLLEGVGIIMDKGDPDVHPDNPPIKDGWIIYCENSFWFVREQYMKKSTSSTIDYNIAFV
tara:strand:+ start:813 stop:1046 length:234 start_codon:yes stop_codon:yes gene_type:complete